MGELNIGNPLKFFELEENFSKKDLKRSYTRKIKLYKPEKFPEEFKKIRSAYEELERMLDYNHTVSAESFITVDFSGEYEDSVYPTSIPVTEENVRENLISRFDGKSKEEVIAELNSKEGKELDESVLFLTLESGNDANKLFAGLIKLLKVNPGSNLLLGLFERLKRFELSEEVLSKGLLDLSSFLNDYLYKTEKFWHMYLEEYGFEKFKVLEDQCFGNLSFEEKQNNYIFYCRLVRKYYFKLPNDYTEDKLSLVENVSLEKRESLDMYLYYLELLSNYTESQGNISPSPELEAIHQIIIEYTEENLQKAETLFYKTSELVSADFLDSEIALDDKSWRAVSNILNYIVIDIISFRDDTNKQIDGNILKLELSKFTSRLEASLDSMSKFKGGLLQFLSGYAYFFCFIFCFIVTAFFWTTGSWVENIIFWLVWIVLDLFLINKKIIDPLNDKVFDLYNLKAYKRVYRKNVIQLLLAIPLETGEFVNLMETVDQVTDLSSPGHIAYHGSDDPALAVASIFGRVD